MPCTDCSIAGRGAGWLGATALVYTAFIREVRRGSYDIRLLGCANCFPDQAALAPLLTLHSLATVMLRPSMFGVPILRPRKYMLLLRLGVMDWRVGIVRAGVGRLFKGLCARRMLMVGDMLARAPSVVVRANHERMASQRGVPAYGNHGRPLSARLLWRFHNGGG